MAGSNCSNACETQIGDPDPTATCQVHVAYDPLPERRAEVRRRRYDVDFSDFSAQFCRSAEQLRTCSKSSKGMSAWQSETFTTWMQFAGWSRLRKLPVAPRAKEILGVS